MGKKFYLLATFALFAALAGATLAGVNDDPDSLNVRSLWCMNSLGGPLHEWSGLALRASDTTIWTVKFGRDTLFCVDASDPDSIFLTTWDIDMPFSGVLAVVQDSFLLVYAEPYIYTFNINSTPPGLASTYSSTHCGDDILTAFLVQDSLFITVDAESMFDCLAFFDISDPTDIDTFATMVYTSTYFRACPREYAIKDSALYGVFHGDPWTYPGPYNPVTFIYTFNIANYRNPYLDSTYIIYRDGTTTSSASPSSPCLVVDSFLFVSASFHRYEGTIDVYDISDPFHPDFYTSFGSESYLNGHYWSVAEMVYQEPYLYAGWRIYDISDYPETDTLVGYAAGAPWGLEVLGKYIYRWTASSFVILEFFEWDSSLGLLEQPEDQEKPRDIFLSVFPNPFNSSCKISAPDGAKISIFDIAGKRVFTAPISQSSVIARSSALRDDEAISNEYGNQIATSHAKTRGTRNDNDTETIWSPAPSLPSGVYLVRAKIGNSETTKRVVYLK